MRPLLLPAMLLLAAAAPPQASPSVQVTTEMPHRGELPDILTAYGTAAPAADSTETLSVQQAGHVVALAVTPGEAVRQGQKLLDFALSAAAASAYRQAENALALARTQHAHTAQLLAQHLATRDQLAQADKAVADAAAALAALQREGGDKPTQTLTAPFNGVVDSIAVTPGERVAAGVPLLRVMRTEGLVVTVGIEPAATGRVQPGQAVRLTPLMGGGPPVSGRVLRVDGMLDPRSRLVDADIAASGALLPGTPWRADITVGMFQGWLVPRDAVLTDAQGPAVYQVANGKAVRIGVRIVGAPGNTDVVAGPLDPARPLVTMGNYQLSDGMAVREGASQLAQDGADGG